MALRLVLGVAVVLFTVSPPADAAQFTNTAAGYTVTVPDGWNAHMHVNGRSLVLGNFRWEEIRTGELFVPGGARIDVQMFPPYTNPIFRPGDDDDTMLDELITPNTTVISRTHGASGKPARLVTTVFDIRSVDAIVHQWDKVFVLTLSCGTDDPSCPGYEHVLDALIASIAIVPVTPTRVPRTP